MSEKLLLNAEGAEDRSERHRTTGYRQYDTAIQTKNAAHYLSKDAQRNDRGTGRRRRLGPSLFPANGKRPTANIQSAYGDSPSSSIPHSPQSSAISIAAFATAFSGARERASSTSMGLRWEP